MPSSPRSTITFAPEFEIVPFDKTLPPGSRLPEAIDTNVPNPSPDLAPQNHLLLQSVRRAADASNLPPTILRNSKLPPKPDPVSTPLPGHANPIISSNTAGKPLDRNMRRLHSSLVENQNLIGKSNVLSDTHYLPNDISELFPSTITIPELPPPSHPLSIDTILSVFHSKTPTPSASPFIHCRTLQAAKTNAELIATFDYDLQKTFNAFPGSTISPGSEFRPIHILRPLLQGHPYWPKIEHDLRFGASYKFKAAATDDSARQAENEALIQYGNHSSAKKRPKALIKVSQKDSEHGWAFPITFEGARKIKNGRFGPLGVAQHAGITETGDIVLKDRLAHDQTFSTGKAPSLNQSVDTSDDIDLVYGWCMERIIHQIVALRIAYPTMKIFVCKFDWGSAYRRINGDGTLAANALTTDATGEFANILSRLSFGGRTHPAMFSLFSETACDLCNDLIEFKDWDHTICFSPLQKLMGPPKREPEDIPFEPGLPIIVDVPPKPDGSVDVYLDDMVQLFADDNDIIPRASAVVPLILHLLVRPN